MLLSVILLLALACSSDDSSPAPDPRADFVGTFEMENFEMRFIIINSGTLSADSIVMVTDKPEIEFEIEDDLNEEELKADFEEFLETLWDRLFVAAQSPGLTMEVESEEEVIASISEDECTVDKFISELTISNATDSEKFSFESIIEGEMEKEEFTMEFQIEGIIFNSEVQLSGTAIGEKQ